MKVNMAQVSLTKGFIALVDDDMVAKLCEHSWHVQPPQKTARSHAYYATTRMNGHTVYMHRFIMGLSPGDKRQVDHMDRNGLNNLRENLRVATQFQNNGNRAKQADTTSRFKGVTFDKWTRSWKAQLMVHGKNLHLGRFKTQEEAQAAYVLAAQREFGEFALAAEISELAWLEASPNKHV